jgi:hypothetical protein
MHFDLRQTARPIFGLVGVNHIHYGQLGNSEFEEGRSPRIESSREQQALSFYLDYCFRIADKIGSSQRDLK